MASAVSAMILLSENYEYSDVNENIQAAKFLYVYF